MKSTFKGIKKAISEYNNAKRVGMHTIFYMNSADKTVWCNAYVDSNSYSNYHSETIKTVDFYNLLDEANHITMKILEAACEMTLNIKFDM